MHTFSGIRRKGAVGHVRGEGGKGAAGGGDRFAGGGVSLGL